MSDPLSTPDDKNFSVPTSVGYNPWDVPSLDEYLFYCCPECELKTKEYEAFYTHAVNVHELARETLETSKTSIDERKTLAQKRSASNDEDFDESVPRKRKEKNTDIQYSAAMCGFKCPDCEKIIHPNLYEKHKKVCQATCNDVQADIEEVKPNAVIPGKPQMAYKALYEESLEIYGRDEGMKGSLADPKYPCDFCDKVFPTKRETDRHIIQKHNPNGYKYRWGGKFHPGKTCPKCSKLVHPATISKHVKQCGENFEKTTYEANEAVANAIIDNLNVTINTQDTAGGRDKGLDITEDFNNDANETDNKVRSDLVEEKPFALKEDECLQKVVKIVLDRSVVDNYIKEKKDNTFKEDPFESDAESIDIKEEYLEAYSDDTDTTDEETPTNNPLWYDKTSSSFKNRNRKRKGEKVLTVKCDKCDRMFETKSGLKRHVMLLHPESYERVNEQTMLRCLAPGCPYYGPVNGLTKLPISSELREKWIEALNIQNLTPKTHQHVCLAHFTKEDFFFNESGFKKPKTGAVPKLHPSDPILKEIPVKVAKPKQPKKPRESKNVEIVPKEERTCKVCDITFTTYGRLRMHNRKIHPIERMQYKKPDETECPLCHKTLLYSYLPVHLKYYHKPEDISAYATAKPPPIESENEDNENDEELWNPNTIELANENENEDESSPKKSHVFIKDGETFKGKECPVCIKIIPEDSLMTHSKVCKRVLKKLQRPKKIIKIEDLRDCKREIKQDIIDLSATDNSWKSKYPEGGPWQCNHCFTIMEVKEEMIEHVKTHPKYEPKPKPEPALRIPKLPKEKKKSPWQCYFCGLIITETEDKKEIKEHVKLVHDPNITQNMYGAPRDHQCTECKVVFRTEVNLKEHVCGITNPSISIQKGEKTICPSCGLSFPTHAAFQNHHHKVHLQEAKFECHQCEAKFYKNTQLQFHIRSIHEKRYKEPTICDVCGKVYSSKAQMQKHKAVYHEGRLKKIQTYKKCKICEAKFTTVSGLRTHSFEIHNVEVPWPYPCTHCDRGFERKPLLMKHLLNVHQITS